MWPVMSAHLAIRDDDQLGAAPIVDQAIGLAREHTLHVFDNYRSMGRSLGCLFLLVPLNDIANRKNPRVINQLESGFDFDEASGRDR